MSQSQRREVARLAAAGLASSAFLFSVAAIAVATRLPPARQFAIVAEAPTGLAPLPIARFVPQPEPPARVIVRRARQPLLVARSVESTRLVPAKLESPAARPPRFPVRVARFLFGFARHRPQPQSTLAANTPNE